MRIQRADWVTTKTGGRGFVTRLARDGSWADVRWWERELGEWTKRMRTEHLIVVTTLDLGDGWTVTDVTREEERP